MIIRVGFSLTRLVILIFIDETKCTIDTVRNVAIVILLIKALADPS